MATQLSGDHPLARAFADFHLLPDLLRLAGTAKRLNSWRKLLESEGCSLDHVEDGDLPEGASSVYDWMAQDAEKLSLRLRLLESSQTNAGVSLTGIGQTIAAVAQRPLAARNAADAEVVRKALAPQVLACHLGRDGSPVADLLVKGAGALAETSHVWAGYCPGLLLVEMDALAHEATAEDGRADRLLEDLVSHRGHAMHAHGAPSPDVEPVENLLSHADNVTHFYLHNLEYDQRSEATVTGLRATAMLLVYAGILDQGAPLGPVQYLTPPAPPA